MRAWFLNLGPPSEVSPDEASADLEAIWSTEPALLVGCEGVLKGKLPGPGKGNVKIRDRSNPGRDNLYAYVRDVDSDRFRWTWEDCSVTFPRNKYPGTHPARSILRFPYRGAQIVVAHKPPLWKGAGAAREEHDRRLARMMSPDENREKTRLLFWDCNGMNGARDLADTIDARVIGDRIDCAVGRRVEVLEQGYRTQVDGHRFATDHPWGAFYLRWRLR